jgi:hypothetical protein
MLLDLLLSLSHEERRISHLPGARCVALQGIFCILMTVARGNRLINPLFTSAVW